MIVISDSLPPAGRGLRRPARLARSVLSEQARILSDSPQAPHDDEIKDPAPGTGRGNSSQMSS